ncbi:hypothetical protein NEOLEDRAFT_1187924, partial [Neolentinus lepideus HHB14362 ss-1]
MGSPSPLLWPERTRLCRISVRCTLKASLSNPSTTISLLWPSFVLSLLNTTTSSPPCSYSTLSTCLSSNPHSRMRSLSTLLAASTLHLLSLWLLVLRLLPRRAYTARSVTGRVILKPAVTSRRMLRKRRRQRLLIIARSVGEGRRRLRTRRRHPWMLRPLLMLRSMLVK